jgi:hypothetical protein
VFESQELTSSCCVVALVIITKITSSYSYKFENNLPVFKTFSLAWNITVAL